MQDIWNQAREANEDLIDSLIAISLLTKRIAQALNIQIHKNDPEQKERS